MMIKPIPELTESNPVDRLKELYRKLEWDGEKVVDPSKVRVTEEDWSTMLGEEFEHAKAVLEAHEIDIRIGVGMLWTNIGPSGGGRHPGEVELHPGWLKEPEVAADVV